jgi:hypothetical protein
MERPEVVLQVLLALAGLVVRLGYLEVLVGLAALVVLRVVNSAVAWEPLADALAAAMAVQAASVV